MPRAPLGLEIGGKRESKAAGDAMRKKIIGEEDELIAKMVEAGVKVTRPDRDQFRALMEPAYQAIKLYAGEDNVRAFTKMVDDERKP